MSSSRLTRRASFLFVEKAEDAKHFIAIDAEHAKVRVAEAERAVSDSVRLQDVTHQHILRETPLPPLPRHRGQDGAGPGAFARAGRDRSGLSSSSHSS